MKTVRTLLVIIAALFVIAAAWYLISPAFRVVELNEPVIGDRFDSMSDEERQAFDTAVDDMRDEKRDANDPMSSNVTLEAQGAFQPRAHDVEGSAKLISSEGQRILRFEDFDTINGPNLHVYLSSDLGDDDYIDLGELKATRGNFNYALDSSIDTTKYHNVLVWCVPFGVLFSYAELQ